MFTERPAGNILPTDFHEAVAMRSGRLKVLAPRHYRYHPGVLAGTFAEIEILRRDDFAPALVLAVSISTISAVPTPVTTSTSSLLQRDGIWIVNDVADLSVAPWNYRCSRHITAANIPFEITEAAQIPAILRLAVDRN